MKQGRGRRPDDALHWWGDVAARYPLLTAAEEVHLGQLIRAWQDHPDGPDGAPAGVRRRGMRARDRMVTANLRLVMRAAGRQQHNDGGNDLLQAGAEGLIKAALRFDPEKGYKFSTYAYWWIWQGLGS
jgi:DNA-directed RNA polymerase sigma subunit (sigma70/sigma32)